MLFWMTAQSYSTTSKKPLPNLFIIKATTSIGYRKLVRKLLMFPNTVSDPNKNRIYYICYKGIIILFNFDVTS